jgi:TonB family protein
MKKLCTVVAFCCCFTNSALTQSSTNTPVRPAEFERSQVMVYSSGSDVTGPELLPSDFSRIIVSQCTDKLKASVTFSAIVDSNGHARNVIFTDPSGTDLDRAAVAIAEGDRFKPGVHGGQPVAVWEELKIDMQGCYIYRTNDVGKKTRSVRLYSEPIQGLSSVVHQVANVMLAPESREIGSAKRQLEEVGGEVQAPIVIRRGHASFTDEARARRISGTSMITLVVDEHGLPLDVTSQNSLGYGLDEKAIAAVSDYRFKPAMKNGRPVPVQIHLKISFETF